MDVEAIIALVLGIILLIMIIAGSIIFSKWKSKMNLPDNSTITENDDYTKQLNYPR